LTVYVLLLYIMLLYIMLLLAEGQQIYVIY